MVRVIDLRWSSRVLTSLENSSRYGSHFNLRLNGVSESANDLIQSLKLSKHNQRVTFSKTTRAVSSLNKQPHAKLLVKKQKNKTLIRSTQTFLSFSLFSRSGSHGSHGSCNVCQCACRDVSTHAEGLRGLAPNQTEADGSRQTETKHAHSTVQCLAYLSLPVFLLLSDSASFFHPAPPPP